MEADRPPRIRSPAVAGTFYPAQPGELHEAVGRYLARAAASTRSDASHPKALIVPHAGYIHSGPVAASAYARLAQAGDTVKRVVLIGPAHYLAIRGVAAIGADAFATPLGEVPVDRGAMALDLTAGRRGLAALGDVVTRWISHLLAIDVAVEPLTELRNVPLTWYVGLDPDATRIGDALWYGHDIEEATRARVVGLYRLTFADPTDAIEKLSGEPVYLMLAMTAEKALRLKPQNLVTGLPVRQAEIAN